MKAHESDLGFILKRQLQNESSTDQQRDQHFYDEQKISTIPDATRRNFLLLFFLNGHFEDNCEKGHTPVFQVTVTDCKYSRMNTWLQWQWKRLAKLMQLLPLILTVYKLLFS